MSNGSKVAAIVVTYNRVDLLKKCIFALENQVDVQINHLIIINNDSTDGTARYLESLSYDGLIIKNLNNNLGGAGGFNKGLKVAIAETNDDYFWIMDDDTFVHDHTLCALESAAKKIDYQFSFLTSNVKDPRGKAANIPEPNQNWTDKMNDGLVKVDSASFVSILFNRRAVETLGYPISDFFIWHDDTEYTIRLNEYAPGYFVANAHVTHNALVGDTQITAVNDVKGRIPRYYYLFRNEVYIMRFHFSRKRVIKAVLHGYLVAMQCLFTARDYRFKRFFSVVKGTTAGLFFNPTVERTR